MHAAGSRAVGLPAARRPGAPLMQQRRQQLAPTLAAAAPELKVVETQEVRTTLVTVEVECGPRNSRRLYAGIDIAAPWGDVWGALTNYDGLSDFIPGLAENQCLERWPAGCRLLQVGEQSLALGVKFRARVVLDIEEHPTGLEPQLINDEECDAHRFPGPRSPATADSPHDITFALHEGDFQAFRGVWRIQQTSTGSESPNTRLSYALFVRPQRWMPIGLIQSRIQGDVAANLTAVRSYAERERLSA